MELKKGEKSIKTPQIMPTSNTSYQLNVILDIYPAVCLCKIYKEGTQGKDTYIRKISY